MYASFMYSEWSVDSSMRISGEVEEDEGEVGATQPLP